MYASQLVSVIILEERRRAKRQWQYKFSRAICSFLPKNKFAIASHIVDIAAIYLNRFPSPILPLKTKVF